MLQTLNIFFWWAAAGVALYYFRKAALAVDNGVLAARGALHAFACGDAGDAYEGMTSGPSCGSAPRPTWQDEQDRLLREVDRVAEREAAVRELATQARTKDNVEPMRCAANPVEEELG